eukprot:2950013-Prymnesium_polylepis.1
MAYRSRDPYTRRGHARGVRRPGGPDLCRVAAGTRPPNDEDGSCRTAKRAHVRRWRVPAATARRGARASLPAVAGHLCPPAQPTKL